MSAHTPALPVRLFLLLATLLLAAYGLTQNVQSARLLSHLPAMDLQSGFLNHLLVAVGALAFGVVTCSALRLGEHLTGTVLNSLTLAALAFGMTHLLTLPAPDKARQLAQWEVRQQTFTVVPSDNGETEEDLTRTLGLTPHTAACLARNGALPLREVERRAQGETRGGPWAFDVHPENKASKTQMDVSTSYLPLLGCGRQWITLGNELFLSGEPHLSPKEAQNWLERLPTSATPRATTAP